MMRVMSLSIFSSETGAGGAAWTRFSFVLLGVAVGLTAFLVIVAYLIDPYDTGRSTVFAKPGVRPQGPRTAAASRGRDPAFQAAVFGNSRSQLLSPERLAAATEIPFVQLTVPGTGPKEQFVLFEWFMRHHEGAARAVVFGMDDLWCSSDPALTNKHAFPFWLFDESRLGYLRGLLSYEALEELPRRLRYLFGKNPARARPDGYWDYEPDYARLGYNEADGRVRLERAVAPTSSPNREPRFPAAEQLETMLKAVPANVAVVLLFPPVYAGALAKDASQAADADRACKNALARASQTHPGAMVLDWRVDRPETRNTDMFFDESHYRHRLARLVEDDIAAALLTAGPARAVR
jgi:hypothetical protein